MAIDAGRVAAAQPSRHAALALTDDEMAAARLGPAAGPATAPGTRPGAAPAPGRPGRPARAAPPGAALARVRRVERLERLVRERAPTAPPARAPVPSGAAAACSPQPIDEVGVTDTEITIGNVSTITGPDRRLRPDRAERGEGLRRLRQLPGWRVRSHAQLVDRRRPARRRHQPVRDPAARGGGLRLRRRHQRRRRRRGGDPRGHEHPRRHARHRLATARLPNNFSPNPIDPDQPGNGAVAPMRYFAEQGVTSAAVVYPAQADARARGQGYIDDLASGRHHHRRTSTRSRSPRPTTSTSPSRSRTTADQLVITTLEIAGMARLAQAFEPGRLPAGGALLRRPGLRRSSSSSWPAPAAEGTKLAVTFSIFEDAEHVPAMATFLDWYARTIAGQRARLLLDHELGGRRHARAGAFATPAARPTRDAVLAALAYPDRATTATGSSRPATRPARTSATASPSSPSRAASGAASSRRRGSSIAEPRARGPGGGGARRLAPAVAGHPPRARQLRPGRSPRCCFVVSAFDRAGTARSSSSSPSSASPPARSTPSPPPASCSPTPRPASSTSPTAPLGMISAFVYWQLKEESACPTPLAALIVLGVSAR